MLLATKGATKDGSVIVAHSDDNELGDQRIIYVPAANYPDNAKRAVYPYIEDYPRYVGSDRGPAYNIPGFKPTKPLGYIDQVKHTYAYIEGSYATINDHQLAFAESTTVSKVSLQPAPGKRILDISALSRIAAERCDTAVCAVKTMGSLAEKYGYYGDGEALFIGDKNEGWLFEISGTPSGTSALWVAEKIPDGTVAAFANEYRIRTVNQNDPNMLYSSNLFEVTQKAGWWNPKEGPLDWLKTVSPGEYYHPYYSLRRVWRFYSLINPKNKLNPWVKDGYSDAYPFSMKPAKKMTVQDVIAIFRDHYEGTPFDLTKGVASGPFNSPTRYLGKSDLYFPLPKNMKLPGAWERPIAMYYCGFMTIAQLRSHLPDSIGGVVWIGLDQPDTTVFVPFYSGINTMPDSYATINSNQFDRSKAWWAFNFVSNWIELKYSYMIKEVNTLQNQLENTEFKQQPVFEKKALMMSKKYPNLLSKYLTEFCTDNANKITQRWWQFADYLVVKYNKGFVNKKYVGYPSAWLETTDYSRGPTTYQK